ncbi:protein bcn92 [Onthophagus taurus]|uniref:protein bcn92 n=1 Tax=Onthophagus taurus TaxID=166361 RepID=UPI000C20EFA8|nr:protein bcn92 [Onthophagus taurus]XP_022907980.1 protein bcn92 [Onthophagus taurus]XP_022907981.1 protein bcn92 [Onthophagus taurus]
MTTSRQILTLYKSLLREATRMPAYNFRTYALRKIRDSFHGNKGINQPEIVNRLFKEGKDSLEMLKRQVIIAKLYDVEKLVIEEKQI